LEGVEETYINHAVTELLEERKLSRSEVNAKQLKQCRSGFYIFKDNAGVPVEVETTFALKSAYDREQRRSKDAQMFGYESINKGLEFIFEIYIEDDIDATLITNLLAGKQRVGRSRTAQYGLVNVELLSETDELSTTTVSGKSEFYLYADSRLILQDLCGNASAKATPEAFGFNSDECELLLEKTQIRVFQYSPWNYKRQSHDTDRYGIEKGSVIAFKALKDLTISNFVGLYQTEGFGHILVNPTFLKADSDGKAIYRLRNVPAVQHTVQNSEGLNLIDTSSLSGLVKNLAIKGNNERCSQFLYGKVTAFVKRNSGKFLRDGKTFASQWGNIRNIATTCNGSDDLKEKLYGVGGYLVHGVAKDKWAEQNRLSLLKEFIISLDRAFNNAQYSDRYVPIAVVNLASEMGKKCKSKSK
jgi:hypothetical protein